MKRLSAISMAVVGVACMVGVGYLVVVPAVRAADVDAIGKIGMVSINKMKVVEEDGQYILETEVTFNNKGENAVKIRNGDFTSSIETSERVEGKTREVTRVEEGKESSFTTVGPKITEAERRTDDKVSTIQLGKTTMGEVEIPGGIKKQPGAATAVSRVVLGPSKDMSTMQLLVRLSSILGNPDTKMTMLLKGTAELGVKLANGWVFEQGKKYEVDLRFNPSVQRKVLFL